MVLKRKRNLKIDANSIYSVFLLKDLDPDELEDYIENRDTGMEADEEKEIHLQNIIKGSNSSIPLPVITEINNISRTFYKEIELNKKTKTAEDCINQYIESKEEAEKVKNGIKITVKQTDTTNLNIISTPNQDTNEIHDIVSTLETKTVTNQIVDDSTQVKATPYTEFNKKLLEFISNAGDSKSFTNDHTEEIVSYCLRRVLLRYEKHGFEPYVCFRDRIFHPTFKSRRNENIMVEKINRMAIEFATLKQMCQLYKERCYKDLLLMQKTVKIVKKTAELKLGRKQRKNVSKMLFEGLIKNSQGRPKINLQTAMVDREKILAIRSFKSSAELFLDIKYYDSVMDLLKYKNNKDRDI